MTTFQTIMVAVAAATVIHALFVFIIFSMAYHDKLDKWVQQHHNDPAPHYKFKWESIEMSLIGCTMIIIAIAIVVLIATLLGGTMHPDDSTMTIFNGTVVDVDFYIDNNAYACVEIDDNLGDLFHRVKLGELIIGDRVEIGRHESSGKLYIRYDDKAWMRLEGMYD